MLFGIILLVFAAMLWITWLYPVYLAVLMLIKFVKECRRSQNS